MFGALVWLTLAFAPPDTATVEQAPDPGAVEFAAVIDRLDEADRAASNDTDAATLAELEAAIAATREWPAQLTADERARKDLLLARLNLARGYLTNGDTTAAGAVIEQLLRELPNPELVASMIRRKFSSLQPLLDERAQALAATGTATLDIVCVTPCTVVINTYPFEAGQRRVFPGQYLVEIRDAGEQVPPVIETLQLMAGDERQIGFDATPPLERIEDLLEVDDTRPTPTSVSPPTTAAPTRRRVRFARTRLGWTGIGGLVIGAGVTGAGAIALAYDGRCYDDPKLDPQFCLTWWKGDVAGGVTMAVGLAAMVSSAVMIGLATREGFRVGVDVPRVRRPALVWTGLVGTSTGIILANAGAIAWSYDGSCIRSADATPPCERLYESATGGQLMLGIGAALIVSSATVLAIGMRGTKARRDAAHHKPAIRLGPGPTLYFR